MPARFTSRIPEISRSLSPAMDIAEREASDTIMGIAKELCPVGSNVAHLRDAIHVEKGEGGTEVVAWSHTAWYGFLVEYGSVHHTIHRGVWDVPPHPFMVPAAELGRTVFRDRADRAIKDAADA